MKDPDEFDQFYKDVRDRLLVLTYCLTGDLSSSRAAVRDAFVSPGTTGARCRSWRTRGVDPGACAHAQRRHTAKLWHREKGLDPEAKATLDALGKLSQHQRRCCCSPPDDRLARRDRARGGPAPRRHRA